MLVVALVVAAAAVGRAPDPLLTPAQGSPFDVGGPSGQVLLVDWNRDGRLDLITRHQQARAIRVHVGHGDGRFRRSAATMAMTFVPSDMKLGDVNGDRVHDLVVTAGARDVIDVLLARVGRPFARAKTSPFAASRRLYRYNKRRLHLVDVNGDQRLDIVTENRRGQFKFRVLVGNGRGHFTPGSTLALTPASEGYTLAFADFNADRHVDVAAAVSSDAIGRVAVHLGDGHGRFPIARPLPIAPAQPYKIEAVADLNGDRRPDLLISHRRPQLSVLLNRARGRFTPAAGSPFAVPARAFALVVTDIDLDRNPDIVGATGTTLFVLRGDGKGGWQSEQSFHAGPGAYDVAVGDVNGDRRPDVIASSFDSSSVTVLLATTPRSRRIHAG